MYKTKGQCIGCEVVYDNKLCETWGCILRRELIGYTREIEEAYKYGNGDIRKSAQYLKDKYMHNVPLEGIVIMLSPVKDEHDQYIEYETMKKIIVFEKDN